MTEKFDISSVPQVGIRDHDLKRDLEQGLTNLFLLTYPLTEK